ncbi:MAG TPA: DNA mismatch repair endonuclease MutL [Anaerolineales bacterium]|nr:DNA mismatch repair endonuclease MutL [Anaerolineales bacterium]
MPIRLLPDPVISQIAAGEVIERPASVVKELLENSLDAGANQIEIDLESGGRTLLRITDNGSGIPAAEVALAFARHATSKLSTADDLFNIHTLGFRGEALASIAAVSQTTLVTRHVSEEVGTQMRMEGGRTLYQKAIGAPPGTVITVENLFFNVPARLKFLKNEIAERGQIVRIVSRYAMAYPQVRFRLMHGNRTLLHTNGTGELRDVLVEVMGAESARQMLPVRSADASLGQEPIQVQGFVSHPALTRANRGEMIFFVNGRLVQDQKLSAAVLQAYHTHLMVGRFPLCVLRIELPAAEVDVNAHPTKAEVRFRFPDQIFRALHHPIRQALLSAPSIAEFDTQSPRAGSWFSGDELPTHAGQRGNWGAPLHAEREALPRWNRWDEEPFVPESLAPTPSDVQPSLPSASADSPDFSQPTFADEFAPEITPTAEPSTQTPLPTAVPLMRVIGQVGAAYIVAEGPDGLYLIDQHAAHERVLYEAFMEQAAHAEIASQRLLQPVAVEVSAMAFATLEGERDALARIGLEVEVFGRNAVLVRSLPSIVGPITPEQAVRVVVDDFEEDEAPFAGRLEARLIARVCKRAAVKAGQVLSLAEQRALVQSLEQCESPRSCPHGRPTMIHLSVDVLEKQFRRK